MNRLAAAAALLITTFFWGVTFTIVKDAISHVDVFVFLAQRFVLASLILLPIAVLRGGRPTWQAVFHGSLMGLFLFGAYAFQTIALLYTSASNTAFLTGLNVVLVPLLGALFLRHNVRPNVAFGAVLAIVGLFFLCTEGTWKFNSGDVLAAICAVSVTIHLLLTGVFASRSSTWWLTTVQLAVVGILSTAACFIKGVPVTEWEPDIAWTLFVCVFFATIFAFLVQTFMQKWISSSHTALIFCSEPVFAALYAWIAAGERLGMHGLAGAVLILGGMVLSQVEPEPEREVVLE